MAPQERNIESPTRTDEELEMSVGNLLRLGVLLSSSLVGIGALMFLIAHGCEATQYTKFSGEPEHLRRVTLILSDAMRGSPRDIIQLGLLLLIATPVARVILAACTFMRQRDWLYVAVCMIVLTVLTASLVGITP